MRSFTAWTIGLIMILASGMIDAAKAENIDIPSIGGLKVTAGEAFTIPGATNSIAFRFKDGRIAVTGGDQGIWSHDGGQTWSEGPKGPATKTAIDLGGGEILAFGSGTNQRDDGLYELGLARSTDNWATQRSEKAIFDIPRATFCGGDDGDTHEGLIVHHGAIELNNGDLMITMYGNYQGDDELGDAYPVEFGLRKYRTVVVTSSDKGKTWGDPVTVAYQHMLARGLDDDSSVVSYRVVPAVTQEGFCEADLTRAPNGDIICMMRSGGRTPAYAANPSNT